MRFMKINKEKLRYFLFLFITIWFILGVGEINNLVAHRIDFTANAPTLEIFSFGNWHFYLAEGAWYNTILWGMIGLAYALVIILLWFWND